MTVPLRIVIPVHSFEPGGVERVALNLAADWQAAGQDAAIILGRAEGAMRTGAPALNYVLAPEPVPTRRFETLWMMWRLWDHLRRQPTDVVFCPGNTYAVVLVVMKLLLGRRCPPVVIKISNDLARNDLPAPARLIYRFWLRIQGRYLDHFVGMAAPMRTEIAQAAGIGEARISIIEDPALAEDQFAALTALPRGGVRSGPAHFLAIGRLAGQKNFPLLLRAFAACNITGARLTILGEGSARDRLERLAGQLGIADRLALPGHCDDPLPYLQQADALVLSSDYEGVPAVVLEALAAGLPVVSTDCSVSMAGLLGDGQFGQLVPVGDAAALAEALRRVLAMPFDPVDARAAAAPFRLSRAAPRYLALFQSLEKSAKAASA